VFAGPLRFFAGWRGLGWFWLLIAVLMAAGGVTLHFVGPPHPTPAASRASAPSAQQATEPAKPAPQQAANAPSGPRPGRDTPGPIADPDPALLEPAPQVFMPPRPAVPAAPPSVSTAAPPARSPVPPTPATLKPEDDTMTSQAARPTLTVKISANVRVSGEAGAAIVRVANAGERLAVFGRANGWVQVGPMGSDKPIGWIGASLTTPD
jgi:hypothetical protein